MSDDSEQEAAPGGEDKVVRLQRRRDSRFALESDWPPAGDQPQAIEQLGAGTE